MITRNFHMRDGPEPRPPEPPRPEGWLARLRARLLGRRRAGAGYGSSSEEDRRAR